MTSSKYGWFLITIFQVTPQVLYIFGNLRQIQMNEGDPNHHDHHQEPQEDG